ncbi:hypothetical protein NKJ26_02960 [Mesorhizobium sp. M0152]|uniref:hypothetical protein n=1 Tax=Mesorhizobium sp. M0152 TaxID=2956898 RepID=UPI003337F286
MELGTDKSPLFASLNRLFDGADDAILKPGHLDLRLEGDLGVARGRFAGLDFHEERPALMEENEIGKSELHPHSLQLREILL